MSLDTQSKAGVRQVPSTEGQWKLLHLLKEQLEEMGLINVTLSEKGTLLATLPANVPGNIGDWLYFSCGYLTSCSGKNVNPQIVEETIAVAILRWVSAMKFYHRLCSRCCISYWVRR